MKKLLTILFVIFIGSMLQAQWVFQPFDNAVQPNTDVGTNWADSALFNLNFYAGNAASTMDLTNSTDAYEGTGSMQISYSIAAGGYIVRTNYHEATVADLPWIDLSTGTELSLWYKVVVPADTATAGALVVEFKLAEFNNLDERDVWQHQTNIDLFDDSGQWINVRMPLEQTPDNSTGFALQFGDGDEVLQLDKIKGFEIAIATNGSTLPPEGAVLFDRFELVGNRYNPLITFDNSAATWGIDNMGWNAIPGAVTLIDEATDKVEGDGSLRFDYTLSAPEVWGGYIAIDTAVTVDTTILERTALTLFIKNLVPAVADSGRAFMRLFIYENSSGPSEEWITDIGIDLSVASDWTRYRMPLVAKPMGASDRFPPKDGFALKNGAGDGTFNPEFMTRIRIEPFGRGTDDGFTGALLTDGTILLDVMQQSGFQFADKIAPDPPVLALIPSVYSNLVTWIDVPGEIDEKYYVYYSEQPITDVEADGVFIAYASPLPHGTRVYEHAIRSANSDKDKTFYYAVTCRDFAGNISAPAFAGPITNTAKGVTTVSISPPSSFTADGDLSEWSDAQPSFLMQSALGTATVVLNVDGDADCSADVKVAIDANYLYVMMDVTDDLVFWNDALPTYENDAPDLFIGLYNITKSHVGYWRGDTPDYHLRFGKYFVRSDEAASQCDEMIANGTENYYYAEKFPSGYVVEARIPLDTLASKRNAGITSTDVINWKVNDKIPFDIGINDNDDGLVRQGMIFYSPTNKDAGWQNVNSWTNSWISDDVTAVDENPGVAITFNLEQNYPNPFNPSTQIKYSIAEAGLVSVKVFDILGREVADLVNKQQSAGSYTVNFNAQNLATGVYIYRIESGSFQASKKMMLMK